MSKALYTIAVIVVALFALFIRFNNLFTFNSWWADDGGAHIAYIEILKDSQRLPTMAETYVAWHEPTYYLGIVGWAAIGELFGIDDINWWEASQLLIYMFFFLGVWLLTFEVTKNKWIALLNIFIFSVLFGSVKLSGYLTNELLNHTLILYLVYFFFRWKLLEERKYIKVIAWALLLAFATLIKVTASIVVIATILLYLLFTIVKERGYALAYLAIILTIVVMANVPWYLYKQQAFGEAFTINVYEQENKQSVIESKAWGYLFHINPSFLTSYPQAYSYPLSFPAIIVADIFGDYYNLFNNVDRINLLPEKEKILTANGLYSTPELQDSLLKTNRFGVLMILLWAIGFIGYWISALRTKSSNWYEIFALIVFMGGWGALVYNNLRLPYIERGVLKVQFIYFVLPLLTTFVYAYYWKVLNIKWLWALFAFLPFVLYTIIAWPQIFVQ